MLAKILLIVISSIFINNVIMPKIKKPLDLVSTISAIASILLIIDSFVCPQNSISIIV